MIEENIKYCIIGDVVEFIDLFPLCQKRIDSSWLWKNGVRHNQLLFAGPGIGKTDDGDIMPGLEESRNQVAVKKDSPASDKEFHFQIFPSRKPKLRS